MTSNALESLLRLLEHGSEEFVTTRKDFAVREIDRLERCLQLEKQIRDAANVELNRRAADKVLEEQWIKDH